MSFFNPFDDFTPSEDGGFLKGLIECLSDLGAGVWLFLLSPIGFVTASLAWMVWGGAFLLWCAVVGVATLLIGMTIDGICLVRYYLFERKLSEPSATTTRLFMIGQSFSVVSIVSGLAAIGYCIDRAMG